MAIGKASVNLIKTCKKIVLMVLGLSLLVGCDVMPTELDCQQRLMEQVYACVTNEGVDFNMFLIVITDESILEAENGTTKSTDVFSPQELNDTAAFRQKVCSLQKTIMKCSMEAAKVLIETPACARTAQGPATSEAAFSQSLLNNDQRYLIKEQLEAIVGQLDAYCAHPCRKSLLADMRKCYQAMDLDPDIFISTQSGGPVIGDNRYDVEIFCNNRTSLVRCIKSVKEKCPEADLVLGTIDLDLDFMEKGFAVLCEDQEAYLQSIDCFESHTQEVGLCHSVWYRDVLRISREAQDLGWSEERYFREVCGIKLAHIECDLHAWGKKKDESCDEATLTLKRRFGYPCSHTMLDNCSFRNLYIVTRVARAIHTDFLEKRNTIIDIYVWSQKYTENRTRNQTGIDDKKNRYWPLDCFRHSDLNVDRHTEDLEKYTDLIKIAA
ncbi:hypothetical protein RRG08_007855 [Elysia crispata]|uniref:Uncharacterized protein n=1 Tax=Elysia crispata TaxID=231223 RepID=A0AAE0XX61_9GAST|nr:hypothetical protein RRG08_007855 [Elysia crispata]